MAEVCHITKLVEKIGDLQNELMSDLQQGGDLPTCRDLAGGIESIAATLYRAFDQIEETIDDQVTAQFYSRAT